MRIPFWVSISETSSWVYPRSSAALIESCNCSIASRSDQESFGFSGRSLRKSAAFSMASLVTAVAPGDRLLPAVITYFSISSVYSSTGVSHNLSKKSLEDSAIRSEFPIMYYLYPKSKKLTLIHSKIVLAIFFFSWRYPSRLLSLYFCSHPSLC
jgi:hypothetical protein